MNKPRNKRIGRFSGTRWMLVLYDVIIYVVVGILMMLVYGKYGGVSYTAVDYLFTIGFGLGFTLISRGVFSIYRLMWRYGRLQAYVRLALADYIAFIPLYLVSYFGKFYGILDGQIWGVHILSLFCIELLASFTARAIYFGLYEYGKRPTGRGAVYRSVLRLFTGMKLNPDDAQTAETHDHRIRIAIVGAGRVGVSFAEDLLSNPRAVYKPVFFVDISREKIHRRIFDLPVFAEEEALDGKLDAFQVQEIVFALPQMQVEEKKALYDLYHATGRKVKAYDFPTVQSAKGSKRSLREFSIEELLFRRPIEISDDRTTAYYAGKVVMITGGGGSIGSELCRQIAKMNPKELVVLDVYENGAYDVQQELKIAYGDSLNMCVEIVSVCDRVGLETIFQKHRPQIVLHAAAHKHVPLMERNCGEAVKNNVFGTLNTVELSEKYGVERFMMVSTDKAVNPTNVMGATKRMCEMIVLAHSKMGSKTTYSATRFGNVLGSAGSVIPLFKRQIAKGGPLTLTDKRIIRYFMTIPEASQLVLQSGAMAKNGELFVLDMGKPVRILELAENMIRLSGLEPYKDIEIIETGLRPGEKLYEELLIASETLHRTENNLIFVECDTPITAAELDSKLNVLRDAVKTENDDAVRVALKSVVPTFRSSSEVNKDAEKAKEMKMVSSEK